MVSIVLYGSGEDRKAHENSLETHEANTRMEFLTKFRKLQGRLSTEILYFDYNVNGEWMDYDSALDSFSA